MPESVRAITSVGSARPKSVDESRHRLAPPFYLIQPAIAMSDGILIVGSSVTAAVGYHSYFLSDTPDLQPYVGIGVLCALNFVVTLIALGAYRVESLTDRKHQSGQIIWVWTGVFLLLLGILFALKTSTTLSRGATFIFFCVGLLILLAWRGVVARLLTRALTEGTFAKQKTIIIGERNMLLRSNALSMLRRYGYTPAAVFELGSDELSARRGCNALSATLGSAIKTGREEGIENVLLFLSWERRQCIEQILNALSVLPARVHLIPDQWVGRYLGRTYNIGEIWTAELKRAPLTKLEKAVKRAIDLVGAATGILLLSPLMLCTAVLIKLDSAGPLLFTQWRSGFNGRSFRIVKFRTMTVLEDGPVIQQARRGDPRVTRVGRWLRRMNIDELPQLFNVLRGEMSLVGPRPHAVAHDCEYERKIAEYAFRYQLKPGITGWAQCNGYRGETQTLDLMAKRVGMDIWYINNWTIWLDVRIVIRTFAVAAWQSRAY